LHPPDGVAAPVVQPVVVPLTIDMTQRTQRIDELLRQEIGALLEREVQDPRIGFVTVTDVETAPDLRHARVWVSVIGTRAERDETIAALDRAMGFVRRELGMRLRLKRIPELHVRLDETAERGTRVLQLLHELEEGHVPEDVPPVGESLPTPLPRLPREGDAATTNGSPGADAEMMRPRRGSSRRRARVTPNGRQKRAR
jgi:ribosome-binding factor A